MLKPKPLDVSSELLSLDGLMATLRHEVGKADADPFDNALVAAVVGAADAMKAESVALAEMKKRLGKTERKVSGALLAGSRV
ncbi:MAG: hypothetical protein ACRYGP_17630 [Janthinobacterium lividum]